MELQERLHFFHQALACSQSLWFSRYSAGGLLLESDCPKPKTMDVIFRKVGYWDILCKDKGKAPILFSHENGLTWLAAKELAENEVVQMVVFGPFFSNQPDPYAMEVLTRRVSENAQSEESAHQINALLQGLPMLPPVLYMQYAVMLHYCLTEQRITVNDVIIVSSSLTNEEHFPHLEARRVKDRLPLYRAEKTLLQLLTEGDLNYRDAQALMISVEHVPQYTDEELENHKIYSIIFTNHCAQAAVEGGLSVSLSYVLGDTYIKTILASRSVKELSEKRWQIFHDYVQRVHSSRRDTRFSPMVQSSCDFLRLHFAEQIGIEALADRLGYSKYYLSMRFKKETGITVNDYLKFARVERAKILLKTTDRSVGQIALDVGFNSRVFFERVFREKVGMTPLQFRATEQAI